MEKMEAFRKRLADASAKVASWPAWKRVAAESAMGSCRLCEQGVEHFHGAFDEERSAQ